MKLFFFNNITTAILDSLASYKLIALPTIATVIVVTLKC